MLQHFGNFRVILRVDLAGRSRAKILQLQRQSQFLVHVFSQNRKLHRADFQYLLMKTFQIKVFAKEGLLFFFQIQKIQISHIVFQIISRCFGDISVNLGRDSSITDSGSGRLAQESSRGNGFPHPTGSKCTDSRCGSARKVACKQKLPVRIRCRQTDNLLHNHTRNFPHKWPSLPRIRCNR